MKKFLFLAGVLAIAMTSCNKNEGVLNTPKSESIISFQPLAAVQTKSDPITKYETTTGDFRVYAWYQATEKAATFTPVNNTTTSQPENYTIYMNNVKCHYEDGDKDNNAGTGSWIPEQTYYWPKNGKLTFSAYYPADANVHVDAIKGITISDYTIDNAAEGQVDLMFSDRVFDRVSSTETDDNKDYDGVDIVFNHALAAADFSIKTNADYGDAAIKVYGVKIVDAFSKGDFAEGYTTGAKNDVLKTGWSGQNTKTVYTVSSETLIPTTTAVRAGKTCILLPQEFSEDVKVVVSYGIKYKDGAADKYLLQTAEFPLKGTKDVNGNAIDGWEMGKWYHYNFTFTLDEIYFAPSVDNWDEVIVNPIEVK